MMNPRCLTLLILLYLLGITCNNIKIAKLFPPYGSNMDIAVSEIVKTVTITRNTTSFIKIIVPTLDNNTIMPQLIEKTVQKLGTNWLISTNDSFCCESYRSSIFVPVKPIVVEYTPDFYIIPLRKHDTLNHLDAQLNLMSSENSFNPRAMFLLLTLTNQCGDFKDNHSTSLYFDLMWDRNCMSLVVVVLSECDLKVTVISAAPFSDDNICRKVQENGTKQYNSSKWHKEQIDTSVYKTNHKNFNKCTFSVGLIPTPPYVVGELVTAANETRYEFVGGIDLELLNLASNTYNFSYVFDVQHGYDSDALIKVSPNGSMTGIFVDLFYKNLDISIGGIIPHDYNYYKYEFSCYYKFSSFGWAVNDASLAPQWKIFFGAFSQDVWITDGFVFIAVSLFYSYLDQFLKMRLIKSLSKNCIENFCLYCDLQAMPLLQYFSITLGLGSTLQPKSPTLRVLYFSWIVYSLHMCIAYSSMLFLLITNPPLEKEINTVENLKNSGLKVGSLLLIFQRFDSVDLDSTTRHIMSDNLICLTWESCIEDLIKYKNFSLLIRQDFLEYYINTDQLKVHAISEAFLSYGASFMTSKGNPLLPGFDKLILILRQSGLVKKWERDTKSQFQMENTNFGLKGSEKSASVLTTSDFQATFFVLVSGFVLSLLLLFGELLLSSLHK